MTTEALLARLHSSRIQTSEKQLSGMLRHGLVSLPAWLESCGDEENGLCKREILNHTDKTGDSAAGIEIRAKCAAGDALCDQ